MMLRHRPSTKADVKAVMRKLSSVSLIELQHAPASVHEATGMFFDALKQSDTITFLDRAEPIALLALQEVVEHQFSTMFMATEAFFGNRGRPSLYLRRFLDDRFVKDPKLTLTSVTYSQHEQLHRWYKLMGYEPGEAVGAATIFVRKFNGEGS